MKLHLDEDLSPRVAEMLRARGIDAVSAHEIGATQLPDAAQRRNAALAGGAPVTRNARHFVALTSDALRRHDPHAGVIICPPSVRGSELQRIADSLATLAEQYPRGLGE